MKFPPGLYQKLKSRESDGTLRVLTRNEAVTDFFSNDYLGFARDSQIEERTRALCEALVLPNGSTGSRLISGNSQHHEELEEELASFFVAESALLFNSGYDANLGLLSALLQREDLVFYDRLSHASIRDGITLSKARSVGFSHNDLSDLKKKIRNKRTSTGQNYVVVESVYSMDGDQAPLEELVKFCQEKDLRLIVDEAHATGVLGEQGRGALASSGLADAVFARVHTFGKAMGVQGAAVFGTKTLREYLINFARPLIYSTAMSPREVLRIKASLKSLRSTSEITRLLANIELFQHHIGRLKLESMFIPSQTPIQSFLLKDLRTVNQIREEASRKGLGIKLIFSPTVPRGEERIRICLHSFNTEQEILQLTQLLSTFV